MLASTFAALLLQVSLRGVCELRATVLSWFVRGTVHCQCHGFILWIETANWSSCAGAGLCFFFAAASRSLFRLMHVAHEGSAPRANTILGRY